MPGHIILITGGNRGIGKGLVSEYLLRPDHTVIAAVRDPAHPSAQDLESVPKGNSSKLIVLKIDAASETDPAAAAHKLKTKHNVTHLDVLIANAGISKHYGPAIDTPPSELLDHFTINAIGPLSLIQAFMPLLKASSHAKLVALTTVLASIAGMGDLPMPMTAYSVSKAALNYIVRKIHFENEWLVAFVISPGWVQTDMGNAGAKASGMDAAPGTTEQSVKGIVGKIDGADRASASGQFLSFDNEKLKW